MTRQTFRTCFWRVSPSSSFVVLFVLWGEGEGSGDRDGQAVEFYNGGTPNSSLDWHTPNEAHEMKGKLRVQ